MCWPKSARCTRMAYSICEYRENITSPYENNNLLEKDCPTRHAFKQENMIVFKVTVKTSLRISKTN